MAQVGEEVTIDNRLEVMESRLLDLMEKRMNERLEVMTSQVVNVVNERMKAETEALMQWFREALVQYGLV